MAIEVQGLEIQIGARTLLHPTNFHVAKGDKIGLVGRNGAGKTTFFNCITGIYLPTEGTVPPPARGASPASSATCRRTRMPPIPHRPRSTA